MTSRALALVAGLASPIFLIAAVAGWLTGLWPPNPLTFGAAALAVVGGPLLGMLHVATTRAEFGDEDELEAAFVAAPAPDPLLTPTATAARAFHNWRGTVNPVIERRERERRASRYLRA